MAACHRSSILARRTLPSLGNCYVSDFQAQCQSICESTILPANAIHTSASPLHSTANVAVQHQQTRSKITNKTTTQSQRDHLHIPVKREAEIRPQRWPSDLHTYSRRFWTEVRGVHDLACLQRFANFARIYPRYRDLRWLDVFMPQWDSAIQRLIAHDMGMFPANQLARKHPFILNARIEPLQWAKMAVRGRLPAYAWGEVLADIKANTGAGPDMVRTTAAGKLAIDNVNKKWRSPNEPKASDEKASAGNDLSNEEADELRKASAEPDLTQEEEEAWLETVNASAASAAAAGRSAAKQ